MVEPEDHKYAFTKVLGAILGWLFSGLSLQDWVAIVTILYSVMQIILLLPKYYRAISGWWKKRNGG